ncbi:hypothetical protein NIES970_13080 [[Synechococcus] sp. NIES-970]|nr:hypothetical protein NIES970_13080 [[Synechococcus] sp. NIES-970]
MIRHLAQIQCDAQAAPSQLLLLAQERPDGSWYVYDLGDRPTIDYPQDELPAATLVLVHLDQQQQPIALQEATDWLLNVVKHHLTPGIITPEFVQQEREKIEAWRQEITAQSQDFTRRQLELEVRREQLEALEQKLPQS